MAGNGAGPRGGRGSGARVVGVVGASGGVGTSCLACALAVRSALAGDLVGCADATPGGGGIDALFDAESRPGARWPDLAQARGRVDGAALVRHLPAAAAGVRVLSARPDAHEGSRPDAHEGSRPDAHEAHPDALGADPAPVLQALAVAVDTLILDLGTPWSGGALAGIEACDDVVLVVGSGVPALARAAGAAALVRDAARGRAWLAQRAPRGCADLAELVADRLELPLLGLVLDDPRLDDALARGVVPGTHRSRLGDVAERMWRLLRAQERAA